MAGRIEDDIKQQFPVGAWAKDHKVEKQDHKGSSAEDLQYERERKTGQHVVGTKQGKERRRAGTFYNPSEDLDDDEIIKAYQQEIEQEEQERPDLAGQSQLLKGLPAKIWEKPSDAPPHHIWNIRELKQRFDVNWKLVDPQHHLYARHCLNATERGIKSQPMHEQDADKVMVLLQWLKKTQPKPDTAASDDESHKSSRHKLQDAGDSADDHSKEKPKTKPDDSEKDDANQEKGISEEQEHFLAKLISESQHFRDLSNDAGKRNISPDPARDLQPLIDEQDQFTPDNWIPRSRHLTRLTGAHPLNAEPELTALFDAGLITPTQLHYVRNHGAVPKLDWDTHRLQIADPEGLCDGPTDFGMNDIAEMDWICIPVTLACDGNRRGEINRIRRSGGFDWGASGTSCVYWKGVLVHDILRRCGIKTQPAGEAWYLHYEGADRPSEGPYSTSIELQYAMDSTSDVMLAYEMNGHPLSPDHGYPLRSIIPGYVGGRCVKWLSKIWVSKRPSTNHYRIPSRFVLTEDIWDNRVVPSFVTDKSSLAAKALFHNPDTACNAQVLQSVICRPSHGQNIDLTAEGQFERAFCIQGFAYSGGGLKVQKVEVSLDEGKTWLYCFRRYPENSIRHGQKYYTWCFWSCKVCIRDLVTCPEIRVRAWDATKNTQPDEITWNLMGMMNNSIYKVKSELIFDDESRPCKRFLHPCVPFAKLEGWMKSTSQDEQARTSSEKEFTLEEISKHDKPGDAWIILNNKVFDVTSVLDWHPGGKNAIMNYAGKASMDATLQYNGIHDAYANGKRNECYLGELSQKGVEIMKKDAERAEREREKEEKARQRFSLQKHFWTPTKLETVEQLSRDTKIYTFRLPGDKATLGLPIGKHIQLGLHFADAMAVRQYTPIKPVLPDEEDGTFQLLVKTYFPNETPFPPGGTVSNWLDMLQVGDEMDIKGPTGEIEYLGCGKFEIDGEEFRFSSINLIGGGSGITPLYQLIHAILRTPSDHTNVHLLVSNKTPKDTLLLEKFQRLAKEHNDQFHAWFTVSKSSSDWEYSTGRMDESMMKKHLCDASAKNTGNFLCGPPGLIEKGVKPVLTKWGARDGENLFGF